MMENNFHMPHRKWLVKNSDREREALWNYLDDDDFPPLQCLEPQLSLWHGQWVAGCQCGWSHSDPDYDIVWEERTKHVSGRFER